MICNGISVENFRNIVNASVAFDPGVNILYGNNAQGKTSLLEAIYFISIGRSFRSAKESDIISFGKDFSRISLDYTDALRAQNITMCISKDRRRQVEQNGVKITKMSDVVGQLRAVMFCPEHLSMIQNGPSARRSYMDMAISRMSPSYMRSLQTYGVLLRQRNALIKSAYGNRAAFDATVELWSQRLAEEAAGISAQRLAFIRRIESHVATCFSEMTGLSGASSITFA